MTARNGVGSIGNPYVECRPERDARCSLTPRRRTAPHQRSRFAFKPLWSLDFERHSLTRLSVGFSVVLTTFGMTDLHPCIARIAGLSAFCEAEDVLGVDLSCRGSAGRKSGH